MKIKKIISPICFLVILVFMLHQLTTIFYPVSATYASFETYDKQEKNTVQVLALGTSSTYNAWIVPQVWGEGGIAMYTLATSAQPFGLTTEIIDQALETQSPDIILIDLHGFRSQTYNYKAARVRPLTDNFSLINRFRYLNGMIEEASDYAEETEHKLALKNDDYSYYFPLIKYHSRWKEGLEKDSFVGQDSEYMGYYNVLGNQNVEKTVVTADMGKILDSQQKALTDLIEYGKKCDAKLVFTCVPSQLNYEEQIEINVAIYQLEQAGYPVLNMNTDKMYDELGINFAKDLRDRNHLNIYGSEKVTKYLINYLNDNYDLSDHRNDSKYSDWDTSWKKYQDGYEDIIKAQTREPKLNRTESIDYDTIKVIWNRVNCADGYLVFKKVDKKWEQIAVVDNSQINYYCDKVETGVENTYTVKSYKKIGNKTIISGYDKAGITGKSVTSIPYLINVDYSNGKAIIEWSHVNGADGFYVYKKDGVKFDQVADINDGTARSYEVTENGIYTIKSYKMVNGKKVDGKYDESGIEVTIK